jgi:hypothetical protein
MGKAMAAVLVVICWAGSAYALTQVCKQDSKICLEQPGREVTIRLNEICNIGGSLTGCIRVVQEAMEVWNAPECSDMTLVYDGTTPRMDIGYDLDNPDDNINLLLVVITGWPHGSGSASQATLTYNDQNGDILDFDLEINQQDFALDQDAFHNLLVLRMGQALGFEEGGAGSVMAPFDLEETGRRVLSEADVTSLCHLYPAPGIQGPTPSGCACSSARKRQAGPAITILLILLISLGNVRMRKEDR